MTFSNRREAGRKLGARLAELDLPEPVVLGIPRGGVEVAAEVARTLDAPLGVIVARKLGAPGSPELAIGATTADGVSYRDRAAIARLRVSQAYLDAEIERQSQEARTYEAEFDGSRRPPLSGRSVIVVDDGLATGATAIAALRSVRRADAASTVLAVPVGPPATVDQLRGEADLVICLHVELRFFSVGQFYANFAPLSTQQVTALLRGFQADRTRETCG